MLKSITIIFRQYIIIFQKMLYTVEYFDVKIFYEPVGFMIQISLNCNKYNKILI